MARDSARGVAPGVNGGVNRGVNLGVNRGAARCMLCGVICLLFAATASHASSEPPKGNAPPSAPSSSGSPEGPGTPESPRLALDGPNLPEPPQLNRSTALTAIAHDLQAEIAALEPQAAAGQGQAAVQLAYRRLAFDLLFHGGPAREQAMAVAGMRLADARAALDALLQRPLASDPTGTSVRADLAQFVATASGGLHPLPPAGAPEVELAHRLEPLRRAVGTLEMHADVTAPRAWPTLAEASPHAQSAVPEDSDGATDARDRDGSGGQPDGSSNRDGGGQQDAACARAVERARATLAATAWLSSTERESWKALLDGPAASNARLANSLAAFLRAASDLLRGEGAWDAKRLRDAAVALAAQPSEAAAQSLVLVLESAQATRTYDVAAIPAHLRGAAREIQLQARRSGVKLAPMLPRVVQSPNVAADPDIGSAVDAQVGAARDLERLRLAGTWPERLASVRAGAKDPFDRVVRMWAAALAQPHQRSAARANMDAFVAQLELFVPVRLETRIRMGDAAAIEATAGRSQALLAEIDRRRHAWAGAWMRANAGAEAAIMLRAARTMEALAAVAAINPAANVEELLSRWGGFAAPPRGLGIHPDALAARAQLAVEALLTQRDDQVDAHLAALQRDVPVAWLAAQAAERLDPWLRARGGVLAQLDAVCSGPTADSWLGADRALLMLFARYAREESALGTAADAALAETIRSYLAQLARAISPGMGGTPMHLPALPSLVEPGAGSGGGGSGSSGGARGSGTGSRPARKN